VRCVCGIQLEVPTLRGLRELERAVAPPATRRAWGDRQRVVFVLAVLSLLAVAVAGYLAISLPADLAPPPPIEFDADAPLSLALAVHEDLKRGLAPAMPVLSPQERAIEKRRELMTWGIKIALALAGCGLLAAAVVGFAPTRAKR